MAVLNELYHNIKFDNASEFPKEVMFLSSYHHDEIDLASQY